MIRYSGSDIYTLTQNAIYEPLRKCQSAKFFMKKDNKFYMPCSPSDPGAFKMSLHEIPEPENLMPPDVCLDDYFKALREIKATVSEKDLVRHEEFTKEFGQEG
jgi:vacuolar protein-sorting-associated protein 4